MNFDRSARNQRASWADQETKRRAEAPLGDAHHGQITKKAADETDGGCRELNMAPRAHTRVACRRQRS
jgi:hypothetical protein